MAEAELTPAPPSATAPEATPAADLPAAAPVTAARPLAQPAEADNAGYWRGTGRRKTSVARVRIKPGAGAIKVNGKDLRQYFTEIRDHNGIEAPLKATNTLGKLDVVVNVQGGGFTGQAGAVLLGLARALKGYDPALEPILRDNDMLTRDARKVERKKYGQSGARKRFQFSKR